MRARERQRAHQNPSGQTSALHKACTCSNSTAPHLPRPMQLLPAHPSAHVCTRPTRRGNHHIERGPASASARTRTTRTPPTHPPNLRMQHTHSMPFAPLTATACSSYPIPPHGVNNTTLGCDPKHHQCKIQCESQMRTHCETKCDTISDPHSNPTSNHSYISSNHINNPQKY